MTPTENKMRKLILRVILIDLLLVLPFLLIMTPDPASAMVAAVVIPCLILGNIVAAFILFLKGKDNAIVYWLNSIASPAIYIVLSYLWYSYLK
jgi:heme/copper-type cytochrome/quinol oxidase subunit 4